LATGFDEPGRRLDVIYYAMDGTRYDYNLSKKKRWEAPVNNISAANYDTIYGWWDARTDITFTPDTDSPGTTYTVRLANDTNPLRMMPGTTWDSKYEGTMIIEEV